MSYFTTLDEALHLAASQDGHRFAVLNGGAPLLRSTVGTRTLRDPFVGLGPDGMFHLLATDGWTSRSIVHAVSADLRAWRGRSLSPSWTRYPVRTTRGHPSSSMTRTGSAISSSGRRWWSQAG